jgi:hypothetical protein
MVLYPFLTRAEFASGYIVVCGLSIEITADKYEVFNVKMI